MIPTMNRKVTRTTMMKLPFKPGVRVTQTYTDYHKGLDLVPVESDTNVYSIAPGTVTMAINLNVHYNKPLTIDRTREWGTFVKVNSSDFVTFYCHLEYNSIAVQVGQKIDIGQKIGIYGNTGYSLGRHLHLEVRDLNNRYSKNTPMVTGIPNQTGIYKVEENEMTESEKTYYDKLITELSTMIRNTDEELNDLIVEMAEENYQYKTLSEIEAKQPWAFAAVKYYFDNGVIAGISPDNLGLTYNDLRIITILYRSTFNKGEK